MNLLDQAKSMFSRARQLSFAFAILMTSTPSALAQQSWADGLIDVRKLDFGVIATGSEAVMVVNIENKTPQTVHILSATTACRCAEADGPGKSLLQPGEKTTIEIRMNTRAFKQQRDTSLTILFDAPSFAEVRIPISAYIRTDVVFDPGKVDFGKVDYLAGATRSIRIAYAGRPDWQIRDIRIGNQDLTVNLKQPVRDGGNITYELEAALTPEAKPGRIRDILTLVTDDANNPYVPLLVEATVVPDIMISNPNIALRSLRPGQTTTVKVVIQGSKPFLLEDIDCPRLSDCFKVRMSDKENKLQIVEMEFTAPDKPGRFSEEMIVKVKGRADVLRLTVSGSIVGG